MPERVRHPPPTGAVSDERHAVERARQIDGSPQRGAGQAVVGATQVGQRRQHPAPLGFQGLDDLFPKVITDHVVLDAGRQLGHRWPSARIVEPLDGDAPTGRELGQLVVREAQLILVEVQQVTLRGEAGEGHGRGPAAGQQDVTVGGQSVDQGSQPHGAGRTGRQPVHVIDHEAHCRRRPPPHGVGHGGRIGCFGCSAGNHASGSVTSCRTDRGHHVAGQDDAVGVTLLEADPDVLAPGHEPVLGHGLGQQRRLAHAGSAHHRGHPVLPAAEQGPQQPRTRERAGRRLRWLEPKRARHVARHPKSATLARLANAA